MIENDDSRVVYKLETSLTDNARVVIYDHHIFIVQATNDGVTAASARHCLGQTYFGQMVLDQMPRHRVLDMMI